MRALDKQLETQCTQQPNSPTAQKRISHAASFVMCYCYSYLEAARFYGLEASLE